MWMICQDWTLDSLMPWKFIDHPPSSAAARAHADTCSNIGTTEVAEIPAQRHSPAHVPLTNQII